MVEIAAITLATLFATVSPIDISAIFAALTSEYSDKKRRRTAVRAVTVATIVLLVFAVLGEALLSVLGISMASLRTAGGIILLLIGIEMVFARSSGASSTTELEDEETQEPRDRSIREIQQERVQCFLRLIHECSHRPFDERQVSRSTTLVFKVLENTGREVHGAQNVTQSRRQQFAFLESAAECQHGKIRCQSERRGVAIDVLVIATGRRIQWNPAEFRMRQREEQ